LTILIKYDLRDYSAIILAKQGGNGLHFRL